MLIPRWPRFILVQGPAGRTEGYGAIVSERVRMAAGTRRSGRSGKPGKSGRHARGSRTRAKGNTTASGWKKWNDKQNREAEHRRHERYLRDIHVVRRLRHKTKPEQVVMHAVHWRVLRV